MPFAAHMRARGAASVHKKLLHIAANWTHGAKARDAKISLQSFPAIYAKGKEFNRS